MQYRNFLRHLMVLSSSLVLVACGGSSGPTAQVRVVNAMIDYGAINGYAKDDLVIGEGLAPNTTGGFVEVTTDSQTIKVKQQSTGSDIVSASLSPADGAYYSVVAYGDENSRQLVVLTEDDSEPDDGKTQIRVLNASPDAGPVDMYVTTANAPLSNLVAQVGNITYGAASGYYETSTGTYQIRITAAGDKTDIRLDLPSVSLVNKQKVTLILTPTTGGALVNGQLLVKRGGATSYQNASARIRVVANLDANTLVGATVGQTQLASVNSPSISAYATATSGKSSVSLNINGTQVAAQDINLTGGADSTLVVYGALASPQVTLVNDNNRLPASAKAKTRLLNFMNGTGSTLTLSADYTAIASSVGQGQASDYTTIKSQTYSRIEVTNPSSTQPIYLATDIAIENQAVYSLFVLGTQTAPVSVLRRER